MLHVRHLHSSIHSTLKLRLTRPPQVHQTYQVMYIQEVILPTPSLFEENMMSALNSFVLFNKAEIINTIQVSLRSIPGGGTERPTCIYL